MSLDKAVRKLRGRSKSPDDNFVPDKKRSRPMIWKQRFVPVSNEEVEASKKAIVKNTQKSTMWAVRMFMSWEEKRNERNDEKCPIEVLCTSNMAELCHWLCVFVKEARHDDVQPYTPRSLTQLLFGIQCFSNS